MFHLQKKDFGSFLAWNCDNLLTQYSHGGYFGTVL